MNPLNIDQTSTGITIFVGIVSIVNFFLKLFKTRQTSISEISQEYEILRKIKQDFHNKNRPAARYALEGIMRIQFDSGEFEHLLLSQDFSFLYRHLKHGKSKLSFDKQTQRYKMRKSMILSYIVGSLSYFFTVPSLLLYIGQFSYLERIVGLENLIAFSILFIPIMSYLSYLSIKYLSSISSARSIYKNQK